MAPDSASTPRSPPASKLAGSSEPSPPEAAPEEQAQLEPEEPYTIFTLNQKRLIVFIASVASTFSAIASNIYAPAIPVLAQSLHVSNELINLSVTSYMIAQAISPTFWSVFADGYGRRTTYIATFLVFIGACVGLAELRHYYELVILRALQSAGSASTVAIGAGVVGDITTREDRGGYMGFFQAGTLVPTAIGPIIGGALASSLGWRSIFWFLTIYGGTFLIFLVLLLPETLRSLVGNGSIPPKGLAKSPLAYLQRQRHHRHRRSSVSTFTPSLRATRRQKIDVFSSVRVLFSLETGPIVIFLALNYMVWQSSITAQSSLFKSTYGLSTLDIGLTYIANGSGCVLGTLMVGQWLDRDYAAAMKQHTGADADFPLESARLRTLRIWSPMHVLAVLSFGWTLDRHTHISAPIIFSFIIGWTATCIQSVTTTFLVDLHPKRSASATASANLARCLLGAAGTSAVLPLTNAIGVGPGFTLMAGIAALSSILVVLTTRYTPKRRKAREELERAISREMRLKENP